MSHKLFRWFASLFFALALSLSWFTPALAAPPANDNFANAEAIGSLPFSATVDNTDATTEPGEVTNCGFLFRSVWYSFTPAETMAVRVDMAGSAVGGNLDIFLASGPGISDLTFLACAGGNSARNFNVEAGKTYYLRVDSFGQAGALQLNLQQITPPANDNFANAEAIGSVPFSATVDNTDATTEPGEPVGCGSVFRSVWYAFAPAENMAVRVDMVGGPVGGAVKTYLASGPGLSDLTFLACAGSGGSANFQAEAGKTYYLQVDSFGQAGVLQVNLEQIIPPANDNFANAEAIPSLPFSATVDNTNASLEPGEPQGCGFPFRSVWYAFTPGETMAVRVDMAGSAVGGIADIFLASGPGLSDLTFLTCAFSNNPNNFNVEAGKTYYLRVDGNGGQAGALQVNLEQITPPANDNFANAEVIGSLPFSATVDNTNASLEPEEPIGCGFPFRSVWYAFTPAENMAVRADMVGSAVGGVVSIFLASGPGISDLTSVACSFSSSSTNFQLEAGKAYYLRVDSFGQAGVLQVNLEQITPPANDNFANAEVIDSLPFSATVDNTDATIEPGEVTNCGFPNKNVWYVFTPAENMAVRVDITGGAAAGVADIYLASGPGISDLTLLTCATSNTSSNFNVEAGKTYYLRVDGNIGQAGVLQFNLQQITPPANDNFANAEIIPSLPFNIMVDNTDATIEPGEGTDCLSQFRSVWYSFSPTENTEVRINTAGSTAPGNVSIYLASGSSISDLTFLTCTTGGSSTILQVEAGKTYYLRVDSYGQAGAIQVNLEPIAPPANDNFANPEAITSLPFSATVDIRDATNESNEPQNCYSMDKTVWYSFTPTESMVVRAHARGSAINGNVNIYRAGSGISDLQFLSCSGPDGLPTFIAEANQTYYLQAGAAFGEVGSIQINLEQVQPPANDNFANAQSIPSIPFSATVSITDATIEPDEPQVCTFMERTAWYSFTPTENIAVRADTLGSAITGNVNVYLSLGPGISDVTFLGCSINNGSFNFLAESGKTYYLQAGAANGEVGSVQINLEQVATITGRVTDAVTGAPLPGDAPPNASIVLRRCDEFSCSEFVNQQQADSNGRFQFFSYGNGAPLPTGMYQIEVSASLYQTKQVDPFSFVEGQDIDLGEIQLTLTPTIGSISGQVIDALTGNPISATFAPFLALNRCDEFGCSTVNSQAADSDGRFRFETDDIGNPLTAGTYQVVAFVDQYEQGQTDLFDVGEGEQRVIDVRLKSFPVRFSEIQPCADLPATGGDCVYSVKITNGLATKLQGAAWSLVESSLPGSFAGFTTFQTKQPRDISLSPGKSQIIQFKFHVRANNSPYGTNVCAQVYFGQGNMPLFNTVGQRDLFCVFRGSTGFTIGTLEGPQASLQQSQANVTDIEPNDTCSTAQDAGAVSLPFTLDGTLDSTQTPDVDFFKFTGTPDASVIVDLEGQGSGKGTLGDPFLGAFDSACNLIGTDDDSGGNLNSRLELTIPPDGIYMLAATICCDSAFTGGGNGTYQLTIAPLQVIGSISGRVTDAATGKFLPGDIAPFAYVRLVRCEEFNCFEVNAQAAGSDGRFHFTSDYNSRPLHTGTYQVVVEADQYQPGQTELFNVGEGENRDIGDVSLQSYPVRFSNIQSCVVPSGGGTCEFSVMVTNGGLTRLEGKAWSIVDGSGVGSFIGSTRFQTDDPQDVSLAPGKSKVLRFRFRVPGTVADGASICPQVFVGQGKDPFFNTVGAGQLFCLTKGTSGFTLLSEKEAQAALRELQNSDLILPNSKGDKKK